jgi:SOS-response transcriptional repressor LexA
VSSLDRQATRTIYDFIQAHLEAHQGYSPSIREIAAGVYFAPSTVLRHLDWLEAWGLIEREANKARSIRLTAKGWPAG